MADFITVAKAGDLNAGDRLVVEIGSQWIVVFNVDGQYYALEDRCSHDDVPLSDGYLDGCEIECAQHGARFDLATGQHLTPPAVIPVRRYEVRVVDDEIQIGRK